MEKLKGSQNRFGLGALDTEGPTPQEQIDSFRRRQRLAQALLSLKKRPGRKKANWRAELRAPMLDVMAQHPNASYEKLAEAMRDELGAAMKLPAQRTLINWLSQISRGRSGHGGKSGISQQFGSANDVKDTRGV